MAEKMFSDNVVKGLKCCIHDNYDYCKECPYLKNKPCQESLIRDAFELINRKDARIKELEGKVLIQKGLIDRQKTEVEKLNKKFTIASEAIYEIENALNRGSDNDWARETIKEYERLIAET